MANIAKLSVVLTANTRRFNREMKKSKRTMGAFKAGVLAGGKALKGFGIGLGAIAATGAAFFIRSQFKSLDALAKLSAQLKISAGDLQSFQLAANLTGSSTEQLNKGLKFLTKTIGETVTGISTEGIRAFELIQLDANKLQRIGIDRVIARISNKVRGLGDQYQKAALAQRFFGRAGQDLINFLELGSAKLGQIRSQIEAAGGFFSKEDLARIERANDLLTVLFTKLRIRGANVVLNVTEIGEGVSGAVTGGLARFRDFIGIGNNQAVLDRIASNTQRDAPVAR